MRAKLAIALAITGLAWNPTAWAGSQEPGSLLVFPFYDSRPGSTSLITVTNTNAHQGVWIEYRYIDGQDCHKADRTEWLSPNDTLTVVASAHNPDSSLGYLYIYAKDGRFGEPVSFDHLIGQAGLANGVELLLFQYNAYVFEAIPDEGVLTDDGDGVLEFDGHEYEPLGDEMLHSRFIGQQSPGYPGYNSSLILINLTGGVTYTAEVELLIYNDNEKQFSRTLTFQCWDLIHLDDISGAFLTEFLRDNEDDEDEIFGLPSLESGWFLVDGIVANNSGGQIDDPAILTLLVDATKKYFASSTLPFQRGEQTNGALLQR